MSTGKTVVIGGGVGPMAGVILHGRIIENTLTDGTDQDHLEVLHFSRSPDIPDRTDFLMGTTAVNPAEGMARTFAMACRALGGTGREAVGGIPCNTFHAKRVYDRFLAELVELGVGIRVLNMLGETVDFIRALSPGARRIGLLGTTGTRASGVFDEVLESRGMRTIHIPANEQPDLHEAIYNREWGLKAVSPATGRARDAVTGFLRFLVSEGAEAIVLACTELPLAVPETRFRGIRLIDPMTALARALVREAAPDKLRPLRDVMPFLAD